MNKNELVTAVAKKTNLNRKQSEEAVVAMFEAITEALSEEEKVQMMGFGSFEVKHRKERSGVNPRDGSPMVIPASKVPSFKAGKILKEKVAGTYEESQDETE